MNGLQLFRSKQVELELSGGKMLIGVLIDVGIDILVLFNGQNFLYVPLVHVQKICLMSDTMLYSRLHYELVPTEQTIDLQTETISYRNVLLHAQGHFVEIYVSGNKSLHGYLTSIMNNYFVFYSPVYKSMYISAEHMKWLLPYSSQTTPYSLNQHSLPVNPATFPLSRTFEEQCNRLVGQLVVFDQGEEQQKIGLVKKAEDNLVVLINSNGEECFWNLRHLKTVHVT